MAEWIAEVVVDAIAPVTARDQDALTDANRSMDALRIASDFPRTWEAATPKARRAFVERFIDRVVVEDGWLKAVRPKADIAPLLAVKVRAAESKASVASLGGKVQRGGPDRGWDRSTELARGGLEVSPLPPCLFGVQVLGVEALLAA